MVVTMENFKMNEYAWKPIESDGYWNSYSRKWDINYSAILSRLIIEAGKFCECFASDLYIDWRVIETELENIDYCGGSYLFGFRQNGVDHNNFVFSRYKNDGKFAQYQYRSMWRLDITTEDDKITMKLGRCF